MNRLVLSPALTEHPIVWPCSNAGHVAQAFERFPWQDPFLLEVIVLRLVHECLDCLSVSQVWTLSRILFSVGKTLVKMPIFTE